MKSTLSEDELDILRKAGSIVRGCLDELSRLVKNGTSTQELERVADMFIRDSGGDPAFRGYKGYPSSICTSVNEVIVHGIPCREKILRDGDIIGIDVGVEYCGYYADSARTYPVGSVSEEASLLMRTSKEALLKGIEKARSGNRVQDISWAIQSHVEKNGFSVVRVFVGHGIGTELHQPPEIPNFGRPKKGALLEDRMVLAIEPMVNAGVSDVQVLDDGWTAVTEDNRLSSHFEHTVIVYKEKAEIVT